MANKSELSRRLQSILLIITLVATFFVGVVATGATPANAASEINVGVALTFDQNRAKVGYTYVNSSRTDVTHKYDDGGHIRYGLIQGMSAYDDTRLERSSMTEQFWMDGTQKSADLWSYVARGVPAYGTLGAYIQAHNQSAIGFSANSVKSVEANKPFLLGSMRHNNNPIVTDYAWLHSSLHLSFNGIEEEFPFVQEETPNAYDDMAYALPAKNGNYVRVKQAYYGSNNYVVDGYYPGYHYYCDASLVLAQDEAGKYGCYAYSSLGGGDTAIYAGSASGARTITMAPNQSWWDAYSRYRGEARFESYTYAVAGGSAQLPSSDDVLTINKVDSERIVVTKDGVPYRLKIWGFYNNGSNPQCAQTPTGTRDGTVTYFKTKEGEVTYGCLYGEFQQERYVTLSKKAVADPNSSAVRPPEFSFTTDADTDSEYYANHSVVSNTALFSNGTIDGENAGFISDRSFSGSSLQPQSVTDGANTDNFDLEVGKQKERKDAYYAFGVGSSGFRIIEKNPDTSANRARSGWKLESISCVNGLGQDVPVDINLNAGSVDFSHVGAVIDPKAVPIRCTYTNKYEAKATLTMQKVVAAGGAADASWTLSATGIDDSTKGTVVSGRGGSAQVTSIVVPAGSYDLRESLNKQGVYGYELGSLSCKDKSGAPVAMEDADGDPATGAEKVTLAPDKEVTCTFTNNYVTGSISLEKKLTGKVDGIKDPNQSYDLIYTCNSGRSGTVSVKAGQSATVGGIPVGATCSVTESPTSIDQARLKNSSFTWAQPQYSAPVSVTKANDAGGPATLSVTNGVTQNTGILQLKKTVTPDAGVPEGFTAEHSRTFPISYTCTLEGQTVAHGTREVVANSEPVSVDVPAGARCSVSEPPQSVAAGDFSANYYEWSTVSYEGNDATVASGEVKTVNVINTYKIATVPLAIKKVVVGPGGTQAEPGTTGLLGSAASHEFAITYNCGPTTGQVAVKNGETVQVAVPRNTACEIAEVPSSLDEKKLNPDYDWDAGKVRYESSEGVALPGQRVDVGDAGATGVVVNPTKRSFGGIAIAKAVEDRKGVDAGAQFGYDVVCYGPGVDPRNPGSNAADFTQKVSIGLDDVWRMEEGKVPAGSNCLVTETSPDNGTDTGLKDNSYRWANTSWKITFGQEHNNQSGEERSAVITAHAKSTDAAHPYPRVTFTNRFERVYGSFDVTKQLNLSGVNNPTAGSKVRYTGTWSCQDSDDKAAGVAFTGTWEREGAGRATLTITNNTQGGSLSDDRTSVQALVGSQCSITEDAVTELPVAGDTSIRYTSSQSTGSVTIKEGADNHLTMINAMAQQTAGISLTKSVDGGAAPVAFADDEGFVFDLVCQHAGEADATASGVRLKDYATKNLLDRVSAGSTCTLTETDVVAAKDPYRWDPARTTLTAQTQAKENIAVEKLSDRSFRFTVPEGDTAGVNLNFTNAISSHTGSVKVVKKVTGETSGYAGADQKLFPVTMHCVVPGATEESIVGQPHNLANGEVATFDVPLGSTNCEAREGQIGADPANRGLKDSSYAWGTPSYDASAVAATIGEGENGTITISNPITRVFGTLGLVKTIAGEGSSANQGLAARYSGGFACTYDGAELLTGSWSVTGPGDATVTADDGTDLSTSNEKLPLGAVCTPSSEKIDGAPNANDPQYRWKNGDGAPVFTPATINPETRADMAVVNTVEQKTTDVTIAKAVMNDSGAADTGVLKDPAQKFAVTLQCAPSMAFVQQETFSTELASGESSADKIPSGWYCRASEVHPHDDWLKDASYTWADPSIVLSTEAGALSPVEGQEDVYHVPDAALSVQVTNTAKRVTGSVSLVKALGPQALDAVKDVNDQFSGSFTCSYDGQTISAGRWVAANGQEATFVEDLLYAADRWSPAKNAVANTGGLPLTTSCTFAEDAPTPDTLKNASWAWKKPVFDRGTSESPVRVDTIAGAPKVTVLNEVEPVYSTVKVVKDYDGDTAAIAADKNVTIQLTCKDPNTGTELSQSFDLAAAGIRNVGEKSVAVVDGSTGDSPTIRVPAGAECRLAEETLFTKLEKPDASQLSDTSWAWEKETYTSQLGEGEVTPHTGQWTATTSADQPLTLTVTNHTKRVFGSVDIEKAVPDDSTTPTNVYAGSWVCTDEALGVYTGRWKLTGAGQATLVSDEDYDKNGVRDNHVPVGSVCSLTEDVRPEFPNQDDHSYRWSVSMDQVPVEAVAGAVDATHSKVADTASNAQLKITNDQTRHFGSFKVTKRIDGATDGVDPAATYVVNYRCLTRSGTEIAESLTLKAGEVRTVGEVKTGDDITVGPSAIPLDSACTVQEVAPNGDNGQLANGDFIWGAVRYFATDPSGHNVSDLNVDNREVDPSNPGFDLKVTEGGLTATVVNTVDPIAQVKKTFEGTQAHVDANGVWDGTWDMTYKIEVSNPSAVVPVRYSLSDIPSMPAKNELRSVSWAGPDGQSHAGQLQDQKLQLVADLPQGARRVGNEWLIDVGQITGVKIVGKIPQGYVDSDNDGVFTKEGEVSAYMLDPRAQLAPANDAGPHVYSVTLNVAAAADGTGVPKPDGDQCRDGVGNRAEAVSNGQTRASDACGSIPDSPTFAVSKANAGSDQAIRQSDGSYVAAYDVTVTNTSATASKVNRDVVDALTLPDSATLTKAVMTPKGGAGVELGLDQAVWTLVKAGTGDVIAGGESRVFHVEVTFTVDAASAQFSDADYQCGHNEDKPSGIYNAVSMEGDSDGAENNAACQSILPKLNVKKSVESSGGNTGAANFDVTYKITAENLGTLAQNTGELIDKPGFAPGLKIESARIARTLEGLASAEVLGAQDAYTLTDGVVVNPIQLSEGREVPGSNEEVFFIRFNVTLDTAAAGYERANLECASAGDGFTAGHGLFNRVVASADGRDAVADNDACAPVGPRMIQVKKAGTQVNADGGYDLPGAQFALFDTDPSQPGARALAGALTVDPNNPAVFTSSTLEIGKTYWLVETKAPAGHNLLPHPVGFTVGADKELTTITLLDTDAGGSSVTVSNATDTSMATITVTDTRMGTLPLTGGKGLAPYMMVAFALIGGAIGMALNNRRRKRASR